MDEPWNLKTEDTRNADTLPTFIIFCEDQVSEAVYFKFFETSLIKINTIGGQKSKIENVMKAITHCVGEDILSYQNGLLQLANDEIHVWCVFDRDSEVEPTKKLSGDISFNESISTANSRNIKVAWSNDSFELWILLHFNDIDLADEENKKRKTYYTKLTEIFKNLKNPNEDLIKALSHESFSYKKDMKSESNFRNIVRSEIIKKTKIALERATKIEEYHIQSPKPYHEMAPCTMVHHLVAELLEFGKKELPC